MSSSSGSIGETYYDVLSLREDASYDEIRASYRSALLNFHPDKLQAMCHKSHLDDIAGERYLKVQKAWEVLSSSMSRAAYDRELQAAKGDAIGAESIRLEDMAVEDKGEVVELFYQCRCGDYFFIDSGELDEMGYPLLRNGRKVSLRTLDVLPASVVLPCGSCSLKVRLLIDSNSSVLNDFF
ncbi:DPH4 homolog [Cucurbita maxima]|uniref:DPH4 homolog n=1 Tax=Cucurbita maxima TaxID=3661 RepID=A0A6J1K4U3_CUCMA|nr:DPH4 homolog [Cucurbita maxima]XP_022996471.1 DPH4 homolog [Cucurbita maxima]